MSPICGSSVDTKMFSKVKKIFVIFGGMLFLI